MPAGDESPTFTAEDGTVWRYDEAGGDYVQVHDDYVVILVYNLSRRDSGTLPTLFAGDEFYEHFLSLPIAPPLNNFVTRLCPRLAPPSVYCSL